MTAFPTATPLLAEEIAVFTASLADVGGDQRTALTALLDAPERARLAAYRSRPAAGRFLVGRALLRLVLSSFGGVPARAWRFTADAHGRPVPVQETRLRFSVAHAGTQVAVAVRLKDQIGIDIEDTREEVDVATLAPIALDAAERAAIAALPPAAAQRAFLAYWCLKEAYLKARGCGLTVPPADIAFARRGERIVPRLAGEDAACETWCCRLFAPVAGCVLALASPSPMTRIRWLACRFSDEGASLHPFAPQDLPLPGAAQAPAQTPASRTRTLST